MNITFGQQSNELARVALAAHLLGMMGRDFWVEALAYPPEGLTKESRIAIGAVVAAKLSRRLPSLALEALAEILAVDEEDLTWEMLGLAEAPEQSVVEAKGLVVGALVTYASAVLADFWVSLDELLNPAQEEPAESQSNDEENG